MLQKYADDNGFKNCRFYAYDQIKQNPEGYIPSGIHTGLFFAKSITLRDGIPCKMQLFFI